MKLSADVKALRARYVSKYPVPQGSPGAAHEERCRQWSIRFAEQCAFSLPGQGYGMKRASPSRPISKDTLSQKTDVHFVAWDMLHGTGTGHPTVAPDPSSMDITGQTFVPVTPADHLGGAAPPVEPPTTPPTPPSSAPTYSQFVNVEAPQVRDAYVKKHGVEPSASDLYHNAWRRLVEGWSHADVLRGI